MKLEESLKSITPLDKVVMEESQRRWDSIAKPLRSLGLLEEAIIKIAGMTGNSKVSLKKKALVIMCADNGVVEENVTQADSEVTRIVAENFTKEKTSVAIMAKLAGADLYPVDIGMVSDTEEFLDEESEIKPLNVLKRKISYGTKNLAKEPAMTREQAIKAIEVGINLAIELKSTGYNIIATGEMGIGNTTTSSAIASVLLDESVETVTGRGAGLSSKGLERKIDAIKRGIEINKPNSKDAIDVLAKVGGYDIAGLVGVFIGGAIAKVPVVIDGFISAVAALVAVRIEPLVIDYILPSHVSKEPAGNMLIETLGLKPFITCEMCLGEGTGAVAVFPILDMASEVYEKMSTFGDIEIEEYTPKV